MSWSFWLKLLALLFIVKILFMINGFFAKEAVMEHYLGGSPPAQKSKQTPTDRASFSSTAHNDDIDATQHDTKTDLTKKSVSEHYLDRPESAKEINQLKAGGMQLKSGGTLYQVEINKHGAKLESASDTLYLGRDCDALSPQYGRGKWSWANGGFRVQFVNGKTFGFPRIDPPISECRM